MTTPNRPINRHNAYHAHVYFDADTLDFATQLCKEAGQKFSLEIGRIHQKPISPHTQWSCQIKFNKNDFEHFIPWLEKNREGLNVLVHAVTGDDYTDHSQYAYWLGNEEKLNLNIFKR